MSAHIHRPPDPAAGAGGRTPCGAMAGAEPTANGLRLAPPSAADFDAISAWIGDCAQSKFWSGTALRYPYTGAQLAERLAALAPLTAGETTESYGAHAADLGLVAFGQLVRENAAQFRLARIIVHPQWRGRGLGRDLCRLLLARAAAWPQAHSVGLRVYRDNPRAVALYRALGFVEAPPHPADHILVMRRVLADPARDRLCVCCPDWLQE